MLMTVFWQSSLTASAIAGASAIVLLFVYSGLRLSEVGQLDKTTIILTKKKQPDGSVQYFGSGEVMGKGSKKVTSWCVRRPCKQSQPTSHSNACRMICRLYSCPPEKPV